jgi:hypothetical protein
MRLLILSILTLLAGCESTHNDLAQSKQLRKIACFSNGIKILDKETNEPVYYTGNIINFVETETGRLVTITDGCVIIREK